MLCLQQGGQRADAEERLRHLRESGHYGVGHDGDPLLSSELCKILQGLRQDVVDQLRSNIEALEYIDTLCLVNESKPTLVSASIDDVIQAAMQSGHITKPSDWAAVVMLATDMGKAITATALSNALRTNTEALKLGVPSKQLLHKAYIEHTKKYAYPNWSRKTQKEERYFKIAEAIYGIMQVFE